MKTDRRGAAIAGLGYDRAADDLERRAAELRAMAEAERNLARAPSYPLVRVHFFEGSNGGAPKGWLFHDEHRARLGDVVKVRRRDGVHRIGFVVGAQRSHTAPEEDSPKVEAVLVRSADAIRSLTRAACGADA